MSIQIGEVNIALRLNLQQFSQDVQDGTGKASKSVNDLAQHVKSDSQEATAALALLSEEIGVNIPRHLRSVIANIPGIGTALSAAFSSVAAIAFIEVLSKIVEKIQASQEAITTADEGLKALDQSFEDDIEKLTTAHAAWVDLGNAISKVSDEWHKAQSAKADAKDSWMAQLLNYSGVGYAFNFWQEKLSGLTQASHAAADAQKALLDDIAQIAKADGPAAALKTLNDRLAMMDDLSADAKPLVADVAAKLQNELAKAAEEARKKMEKLAASLKEVEAGLARLHAGRSTMGPTIGFSASDVDPTGNLQLGSLVGQANPAPPVYSGTKEAADLYKISTDQNAAIAEAQRVYTATRTAAEQYDQEMQVLSTLLAQGKIDQDTYNRAVSEAKEKMDGTRAAVEHFGQDIGQTIDQALLFGRSWSDAFKSILAELIQLILKLTVFKSLSQALDSSGSGGGFFSSLLGGLFGGFKAEGGPLDSGKWYIAGEHGPEPIWGGGSGAFAAGYGGGPAGASVVVNYNVDARGADPGAEDRIRRGLKETEDRAVSRAVVTVSELNKRRRL